MEYSKEFVTAVVLGKDLVPRYVPLPCCGPLARPHPTPQHSHLLQAPSLTLFLSTLVSLPTLGDPVVRRQCRSRTLLSGLSDPVCLYIMTQLDLSSGGQVPPPPPLLPLSSP